MQKKKRKKFEIFEADSMNMGNAAGPKTITEIRVERFIVEEMDRYIKLHKEHEKDLSYIG